MVFKDTGPNYNKVYNATLTFSSAVTDPLFYINNLECECVHPHAAITEALVFCLDTPLLFLFPAS